MPSESLLEPDLQWPRPQMTFRHLAQMWDEASPQIAVLLASHRISEDRKKQLRDALPESSWNRVGRLTLGKQHRCCHPQRPIFGPGPYEQVRRYIQAHGAGGLGQATSRHLRPFSPELLMTLLYHVILPACHPKNSTCCSRIGPNWLVPCSIKTLAVRATLPRSERAGLLALAIKYQHRPMQEELISATLFRRRRNSVSRR